MPISVSKITPSRPVSENTTADDRQLTNRSLGACPRIENLLRKSLFGQISRSFSLNSHHYSPQMIEKSDQNGFPSLRLLFSDRLLAGTVDAVDCDHPVSSNVSASAMSPPCVLMCSASPQLRTRTKGPWSSSENAGPDCRTADPGTRGPADSR